MISEIQLLHMLEHERARLRLQTQNSYVLGIMQGLLLASSLVRTLKTETESDLKGNPQRVAAIIGWARSHLNNL